MKSRPTAGRQCAPTDATKKSSTRACVVCRAERPTTELLRLSSHRGAVGMGRGDKGRGAYVCASRACLLQLSARTLSRAFKEPTEIDVGAFLAQLRQVAAAKVLEAVGLSRRQGALAFGVDDLKTSPAASEGGLVILAADLSERALKHAPEGTVFVEGLKLGHAAGMGYLGAVRLGPGPLSDQAAYWISLWYESRSPGPETLRGGGSAEVGRVVTFATPVQM